MDEKAAYIAAPVLAHGRAQLGALHPEGYPPVDELRGDSYGFGDFTQERRYIAGPA